MAFVMNFAGNAQEAAQAAGYADPASQAAKLMAIPEIAEACNRKMQVAFDAAAKKMAKAITKTDVIKRLNDLANLDPDKTNNTIHGQVAACKAIGEMQGYMVKGQEHETFRKQLEGKTEEEKEFFAEHGYWPQSQNSGPSSVN